MTKEINDETHQQKQSCKSDQLSWVETHQPEKPVGQRAELFAWTNLDKIATQLAQYEAQVNEELNNLHQKLLLDLSNIRKYTKKRTRDIEEQILCAQKKVKNSQVLHQELIQSLEDSIIETLARVEDRN